MSNLPNVVIVGGGGANAQVARLLSLKLNPTEVQLRPPWIRASVTEEGNLEERAHIPYDRLFGHGHGRVVLGKVKEICAEEGEKGGSLTLENGEKVPNEVLVLTLESLGESPLDISDTKKEMLEHLAKWRQNFKEAKDIVLVGGGAVALGTHEDLFLNDAYSNYFRKDMLKSISKRGVEVTLNDKIDDLNIFEGLSLTLWYPAVVDAQTPTLSAGTLSHTKHIRASSTLQVFNYPRIFAGSDAIEWGEQKQVSKWAAHASVMAENVVAVLKKEQPRALYPGPHEMIVIPNGKHGD